jgi:hypothetical protein
VEHPWPSRPEGGVITAVASLERTELTARLRTYVTNAHPATLTCVFRPGGRLQGAGIVSHFYCVNCNQSRHLHDVAAVVREFEREELR